MSRCLTLPTAQSKIPATRQTFGGWALSQFKLILLDPAGEAKVVMSNIPSNGAKAQGLELPSGNSHSKFQQTSKARACAICGNETGHCKTKEGDRGDLLHYCHNHATKPSEPINGHYFTATAGDWGIFSNEKPKYQGAQSKAKSTGSTKTEPAVSPTQRDSAFRAYMSNLTLHEDDRADLHRRGVTDEQIASWGVVSIEGKEPGYMVPCYSPEGLIVGAQWRLRKPSDGARYKWISWIGGGSKNGDELPLTVHRPIGVEPVGIAVCEGIGAKSFILAQRSGLVAIGAGSDSQFISSPDHWREYLAAVSTELGTTTVTMYPDSGAVKNAAVMGKYSQWFKFVADLGYEVQVAWWGQTVKGESPDPDELSADVDVKLISVAEFEAMAEPEVIPQEIPWKCLPVNNNQFGDWKSIDVPIVAIELIERNHDRALRDPNFKYIGPCTVKKEDFERFSEFQPKTNFNLDVSKILEDSTGGGIEFKVTCVDRSVRTRRSFVKTDETLTTGDFMKALTRGIGGHVTSNLKMPELAAIIQNRKTQYSLNGGLVYRLAPRTGRQEDEFWVFEHGQFNPQGQRCTEDKSRWMFNRDLGIDEQIVSPKIAPQSIDAIPNLITAAKSFYHGDTFPLAMMTLGYGVATVHREEIMKDCGSFPQLNVFGDPGGGKTLAATMACSLFGTHMAPISSFSESVIYETVKSVGSLLLLVDDPLKKERRNGELSAKVDSFTWNMYGGAARKVRGNEQRPHTNVVITSNKAIGEGNQAIESRMIKMSFPVREFDQLHRHALVDAMAQATGGLGQLIGLEYQPAAIRETALKLTPHLKGAHARLTDNYALLVHYTDRLCKLAGLEFDAMAFCIKTLCPQANQFDSDKDSLTDFLEKLATMRSDGAIGEWNMSQITKNYESYLAVQLHSIWPEFAKRFEVNYSRQSIEALIIEHDGIPQQNIKFVPSKSSWQEYQKAANAFAMGTGGNTEPKKPKKTAQSRCVLIPSKIVDKAIGGDGATETNYSDNPTSAPEPSPETTPATPQSEPPEPIAVPQPECTAEVKAPNQPDIGVWESEQPALLSEKDLEEYRAEIQADPSTVDTWKLFIPQSQWSQAGILEDERCAA